MNINWVKIGKVAGFVLPAIGGVIGGLASSKENSKIVAETTKKLFEEQNQSK